LNLLNPVGLIVLQVKKVIIGSVGEEQLLEFAWEIYRNFCDEK